MTERKILISSIDEVKEFIAVVNAYQYDIDLRSGKYVVDAKSIMGIFSLDLSKQIDIIIHTADCTDLLDEISKFLVK